AKNKPATPTMAAGRSTAPVSHVFGPYIREIRWPRLVNEYSKSSPWFSAFAYFDARPEPAQFRLAAYACLAADRATQSRCSAPHFSMRTARSLAFGLLPDGRVR